MKYDLVIKNGCIVTSKSMKKMDIGIIDGKIYTLSKSIEDDVIVKKIDAEGMLVFPGGIDCHAHLNEPGYEWREDYNHGTKSAAAGGITTIIDMPLQNTPSLINKEAFYQKEEKINGKSYVDYGFWGGLVDNNLDEIEGMYEAGVFALKAFLSPASPDFPSSHIGMVYHAMKKAKDMNLLLGFHCEDYSMISFNEAMAKNNGENSYRSYLDARPVIAEEIATQNILDMAKETGARVHICHVSHPGVAKRIKKAIKEGVKVTAETCMHYLIYTEEDLIKNGGLFKCSPPLRKEESKEKLWDYVLDGTLSSIVSDHSPAAEYEKENDLTVWDTWGGISGLQTSFQIMYEYGVNRRGLSPCILASRLSESAAENFEIDGKGKIEIGYDADFIIFDPQKSWEITKDSLHYKNKISSFCGLSGKGVVNMTILRGKIIYNEGEFSNIPKGQILKKINKII